MTITDHHSSATSLVALTLAGGSPFPFLGRLTLLQVVLSVEALTLAVGSPFHYPFVSLCPKHSKRITYGPKNSVPPLPTFQTYGSNLDSHSLHIQTRQPKCTQKNLSLKWGFPPLFHQHVIIIVYILNKCPLICATPFLFCFLLFIIKMEFFTLQHSRQSIN